MVLKKFYPKNSLTQTPNMVDSSIKSFFFSSLINYIIDVGDLTLEIMRIYILHLGKSNIQEEFHLISLNYR